MTPEERREKLRQKAQRWRDKNRDKFRAQERARGKTRREYNKALRKKNAPQIREADRERYHSREDVAEGKKARAREWHQRNRARSLENKKRWHEANREKSIAASRRSELRRKYGLTPEDVERMREEQAGACALCGEADPRLVVDHNHATGEVRRLLCRQCNSALGMLRDDPQIALAAAAYLTTYGHGRAAGV